MVDNLRQIKQIDKEESVWELVDGKFPKFYFDHSNHVEKVDSWLMKIQKSLDNKMFPLSPAIIVDSPKSGKSALLTRIMPHKIRAKFPSAFILFIDFLTIPAANNHHVDMMDIFGKVFIERLVDTLSEFGFNLKRDDVFNVNITIQTRLRNVFRLLNDWLSKKKCLCFMIWDEIQRWFQLNNSSAGAIFNDITLNARFGNIAFAVTGSSMVTSLENIVRFPSNGTSWMAEATQISVFPQVSSDSFDSIAWQADELAIASQMFKLLQQYYPDSTPDNLLDYVCGSNPAVLAYFCYLHKSNNSNPGSMKATLNSWYDNMWSNFKNDSLPLLKRIQADNSEVLSLILHIASGTVSIDTIDFNSFGKWQCLFETILRQTDDGKVIFVGCYGYYITRCCEVDQNGELKITAPETVNNELPIIPSVWATVSLLSEMMSRRSVADRTNANKVSEAVIKKCNSGMPIDFATDGCFLYFLPYGDATTFDQSSCHTYSSWNISETRLCVAEA